MKVRDLVNNVDQYNAKHFKKFFDYLVVEELGKININGCPGYQYLISKPDSQTLTLTMYKNWIGGGARLATFMNVE